MVDDGTTPGPGDDRTVPTPPPPSPFPPPPAVPPGPPPPAVPPGPPPAVPPLRAEVTWPPAGAPSADSVDDAPDDAAEPTVPDVTPAAMAPGRSIGPVRAGESDGRRRPRRQTWTFLGLLAGVLVLGLLSAAVFLGALTWPFGGSPGATPSPCPSPVNEIQSAALTKVRVLNASDRRGLALATARELQKRGFKVPSPPGNDTGSVKPTTAAVVRHGLAGATAARTVATQVKGKVADEQDDRLGEVVDLVLGQTFALVDPATGTAALRSRPTPSPSCRS